MDYRTFFHHKRVILFSMSGQKLVERGQRSQIDKKKIIGIFDFFPYITLVFFLFQGTGHNFSPRNVIFGLREPCTIEN